MAAMAASALVAQPAGVAAVRHRDRHAKATGRDEMAKWRGGRDVVYRIDQREVIWPGKAAQQHCTGRQRNDFVFGRSK